MFCRFQEALLNLLCYSMSVRLKSEPQRTAMRTRTVSIQAWCSQDSPDMCRLVLQENQPTGWVERGAECGLKCRYDAPTYHCVRRGMKRRDALCSLRHYKTSTKSFGALGRLLLRTV